MTHVHAAPNWHEELLNLKGLIELNDNEQVHLLSTKLLANQSLTLPTHISVLLQTILCKSLLNLEKYDQVLEFCQKNPGILILEHAYALYRLHKYDSCKEMILLPLQDTNLPKHIQRGLMHTLAQCYYRLNETTFAWKVYQDILMDADPRDRDTTEALVNALAVAISNHTFTASPTTRTQTLWSLAETILEDTNPTYPYDLAYNLATGLLVHSTGQATKHKAMKFLNEAESSCKQDLQEAGTSSKDDIGPIRANIGYGKILLGDLHGAMRLYSDMSDDTLPPGVRMTVDHNMAIIQYWLQLTREEDVYKRLPNLTMDKKATPNQIRTVLWNRIRLSSETKNIQQCQTDIQFLRDMLRVSRKEDGAVGRGKAPQRKTVSKDTPPFHAAVAFPEDEYVWNTRLAMVEHAMNQVTSSASTSRCNLVADMKAPLHSLVNEKQRSENPESMDALEYALAELDMYQCQRDDIQKDSNKGRWILQTLEKLPPTIRSRPAIIATLSTLYQENGMHEQHGNILKQSSDAFSTQLHRAHIMLSMKEYHEAVNIYQSILSNLNIEDNYYLQIECQAQLAKALSFIDVDKADEYLSTMDVNWRNILGTDYDHGEELECMEIPRLSKGAGSTGKAWTGARRVHGESDPRDEQQKKNKEHTLERRARKREEYLKKLTQEGKYNPDRPTAPDPERWLPKSQRSYSKRGRKARKAFVGSQGAGAGTEKDASRLDVVAKLAAQTSGTSSKPSTAHLAVSSSAPIKNRRR